MCLKIARHVPPFFNRMITSANKEQMRAASAQPERVARTAAEVDCFDRQIVVNAIENFPAALECVLEAHVRTGPLCPCSTEKNAPLSPRAATTLCGCSTPCEAACRKNCRSPPSRGAVRDTSRRVAASSTSRFQPRLSDGMIRCCMGVDKVVGFGRELIEALVPPPEGTDSPAAQPGPPIPSPSRCSERS